MKMTLLEYIDNPMGGRITQKDVIRRFYTDKFDKLLLRENGHIEHHLYMIGNVFIIHFKIPSEAVEKVYYDVVFEFSPSKKEDIASQSLENYNVRFFSNDPAFVFNYAYVFKSKGLLIEDLSPLLGKAPLNDAPKVTNPNKIVGHVKSFYFAYLFMKTKGLFKKVVFTGNKKTYISSIFKQQIATAESKLEERQNARIAKDKSERAKEAHKRNNEINPRDGKKGIINTIKTKLVKSVKTTKKTKLIKPKR